MKADLLTLLILPLSLFIIMLGMGLSLKTSDFLRVCKEPKAFGVGLACQMLLLPVIGVAVIVLFDLPAELAVGLMILTFCPGGTTSNMFSYLAKGDVALSISLTAVISLLTPFTIPLLTVLAMKLLNLDPQNFNIPLLKTILQLVVITIVPVAIGMLIHHRAPAFARKAAKPVKIFSIVFLFVIIAGIVAKNRQEMVGFFLQTGAATLSLNIIALLAGFMLSQCIHLKRPESITIAIEVGIQNGTLALLVTGSILQNATMTIPAVTYSLLMFVTGGLFTYVINLKAIPAKMAEKS